MRNHSIKPYRATYPWPPLPTAADRSKLDRIRDDIRDARHRIEATKATLDRISTGSDGRMGLDRMGAVVDRHDQFISDRRGALGRLFQWAQTR